MCEGINLLLQPPNDRPGCSIRTSASSTAATTRAASAGLWFVSLGGAAAGPLRARDMLQGREVGRLFLGRCTRMRVSGRRSAGKLNGGRPCARLGDSAAAAPRAADRTDARGRTPPRSRAEGPSLGAAPARLPPGRRDGRARRRDGRLPKNAHSVSARRAVPMWRRRDIRRGRCGRGRDRRGRLSGRGRAGSAGSPCRTARWPRRAGPRRSANRRARNSRRRGSG